MLAAVVTAITLTKPQYQQLMVQADKRVTIAEGRAESGITPHATRAHVATLLNGWAAAEAANARMFARADVPAPVRNANALLVRGERAYAAELRHAAREVRTAKSPKQVIGALFSNATGPRLVDRALAQLKKLGY